MSTFPFRVFPPTCLLCGAPGVENIAGADSLTPARDLCTGCYADLPFNHIACERCGIALPYAMPTVRICAQCQRTVPLLERTITPFFYQEPFDYLIKTLKFQRRLETAPLLAELLGNTLTETLTQETLPQCIIPIPLHPRRLRERGFNQATEIAKPLARRFKLPLLADAVQRSRHTVPQIELSLSARTNNLKNAFVIARSAIPSHVAILDDVVTTGSTVREMAKALQNKGVDRIQVWACARTPLR